MIDSDLVAVDPASQCHVWLGRVMNAGYGVVYIPATQKKALAHRVAYETAHGPIPNGLELDHLCRNRKCVNPDHLEAVAHRENTLRGAGPSAVNARRTECIHGHAFTPENTRLRPDGKRQCRQCDRERKRGRHARRQARQQQSPDRNGPVERLVG